MEQQRLKEWLLKGVSKATKEVTRKLPVNEMVFVCVCGCMAWDIEQ